MTSGLARGYDRSMATEQKKRQLSESFPAGTRLFDVNDDPGPMYVIQRGRVKIERKRGKTLELVAELSSGDFFGELAIFNGRARTHRATVIEDAQLLIIDAKTLASLLKRDPEIAIRLLQDMARRLDRANALVEVYGERDPVARVVLELARLNDHEGEFSEAGRLFVATERKALAERVSAPETLVARTLRRLARLGLAFEVEGGIETVDPARLREFRDFLASRMA